MKKAIIIGIALAGVSSAALARPELNAFINKPANSIPELIAQIKADRVVADRYMRHFSMTRGEVLEYVSSLRLGTIQRSDNYTVYSVPEGGMLKAHVSFFKKGTPAFVDADGNPILRVKCGNPFVRGPVKAYAMSPMSVDVQGQDSAMVALTTENIVANASDIPVVAGVTPKDVVIATITTPPVDTTSTSTPTTSRAGNPFGLLGALGAGASFVRRGGGQPVPEPATMLAMAAGVAGLAARRRRKS